MGNLFHGQAPCGNQCLGLCFAHCVGDVPEASTFLKGTLVRYDNWVRAGSDLIDVELARDDRPIALYGISAGGMLTYHVAAQNKKVKGIVDMTFLDQRLQQVRDATALSPFMSRIGSPMMNLAARTPLKSMRMPMTVASKMSALVNNRAALKVWLCDKRSAGSAMTMTFLSSYVLYQPAMEPAEFDVCPILLTQPAADRWTPLHLSEPFLKRVARVPVKIVMLENAGHYPLEQPGRSQMVDDIDSFSRGVTTRSSGTRVLP